MCCQTGEMKNCFDMNFSEIYSKQLDLKKQKKKKDQNFLIVPNSHFMTLACKGSLHIT